MLFSAIVSQRFILISVRMINIKTDEPQKFKQWFKCNQSLLYSLLICACWFTMFTRVHEFSTLTGMDKYNIIIIQLCDMNLYNTKIIATHRL